MCGAPHCKDGKWVADGTAGKEWGTEVPLGAGDVGMENYLRTLKENIGYTGPLTIEREIVSRSVSARKPTSEWP